MGGMVDDFEVTDAIDSDRFELRRAGELMGYATYRRRGDAVVVPHVETLVQYRGQPGSSRSFVARAGRSSRTVRSLPGTSAIIRMTLTSSIGTDAASACGVPGGS